MKNKVKKDVKTKNSELTEVTAKLNPTKKAEYHQFHQVDGGSTLCGKMFDSKMQLAWHEKTMHCGQPRHTCQFCSKGFMNKGQMKRHMVLCTTKKSWRI